MNSPSSNLNEEINVKTGISGINMPSVYRTLARVLVNLDEDEYTEDMQQSAVYPHDALPDQASDLDTREAS